jgi:methionyl-tRNA formyltransferase
MSSKLKIVFAGTPEIADIVLNKLIKNNFDIRLVVTQPDRPAGRGKNVTSSPVKLSAIKNNIRLIQPEKIRKNYELFEEFKLLKPDVMIVIAYGMIIPQELLNIPHLGCINIHVSLLPKYRGAAPIQRVIEFGESQTGITIMKMDEGLDTGDILLQHKLDITKNETARSLHDKLADLGSELIVEYLHNYRNYLPVKQNSIGVSYAHKIMKEEARINWNETNIIIERKVRAFNPFPICYTSLNNLAIKIWSVRINDNITVKSAGSIVDINKNIISVACGDGTILDLLEIQLPGKKQIKVADFLLGYKISIDQSFQ